jgi:N4-gp56 family major capsid protein
MTQRTYSSISGVSAPVYCEAKVLERAGPHICLDLAADTKPVPKNAGNAVNFRRWRNPAVSTTPVTEGVNPTSRALAHDDYNATINRFAEVFEESRYNYDLDVWDSVKGAADVLGDLIQRTREQVRYNVAKAGSGVLYNSSAVSTRNGVNGAITVGRIDVAVRALEAAKAMTFTQMQKASTAVSTAGVEPAYFAFGHTDLMPDLRRLAGFRTVAEMANIPREAMNPLLRGALGSVLFFLSPELDPFLAGGAAVGSTGMKSAGGTSVDVYPLIIVGQHALGSIALRGSGPAGRGAVKVNILDQADKSDPTNERVYISAAWYDQALRLSEEWMQRVEVGVTANPI